jgi:hypothetical protein
MAAASRALMGAGFLVWIPVSEENSVGWAARPPQLIAATDPVPVIAPFKEGAGTAGRSAASRYHRSANLRGGRLFRVRAGTHHHATVTQTRAIAASTPRWAFMSDREFLGDPIGKKLPVLRQPCMPTLARGPERL